MTFVRLNPITIDDRGISHPNPRIKTMKMQRFPQRSALTLLAALAVLASKPVSAQDGPVAQGDVWDSRIAPRLRQADREAAAAAAQALTRIGDFIAERKGGARPFAQTVLGIEAKARAADDALSATYKEFRKLIGQAEDAEEDLFWRIPGQKLPSRFEYFVQDMFHKYVISPYRLQVTVAQAIGDYVAEVRAIENRLLVAIRADVGDDFLSKSPAFKDAAAFRGSYEEMLREVGKAAASDLNVSIAREAASWIGGDIATAVTMKVTTALASKLGVSGGIIGTGAASSIATFGVGIAVSFGVDYVIDQMMKLAGYDAEAAIIDKVNQALEETRKALIEGEGGLRSEFRRMNNLRSTLRKQAIRKLFSERGAL